MLRRSLLDLSTRRMSHIMRLPRQITAQNPSLREFSTTPKQNVNETSGPSPGKPSESGGGVSKVLIGSVAIGTAVMVAYSTGYLDPYLGKEPQISPVPSKVDSNGKSHQGLMKGSDTQADSPSGGEQPINSDLVYVKKSIDSLAQSAPSEDCSKTEEESQTSVESTGEESNAIANRDEESPNSSNRSLTDVPVNESIGTETLEDYAKGEQFKGTESAPTFSHADMTSQDNVTEVREDHLSSEDKLEDVQSHEEEPQQSLLDEYNLRNKAGGETAEIPESGNSSLDKEIVAPNDTSKAVDDIYVSKDGKLILDFLQALHAAEQRQAELDARIYSEEKRLMKQNYEKELKDARARELMYAEEVAMLEKEIKKETAKAAAALKSLQEKAEERLKMELEIKEKEAELKIKEVEEIAKAELAAAIAREKATQILKMADAEVNINALCMAFYAQSEEARQTHSVHKLALGALALEDALSEGRPIRPEVDAIRSYINDVDIDSLLDLVLSSLPDEIQSFGTDTPLQLNQKFDQMTDKLRHFSLMPPGGGGILAHSLAHIASFLKVREADKSGNGIESVINRVQSLLAEGKLVEAADALESGVHGSEAHGVVGVWVRQARNRAITEQALMLLQSYTTCISLA